MAKINESTVTITVSQLGRNTDRTSPLLNHEIITQLEAVIIQLLSESAPGPVIVEIELKDSHKE